MLSIASLISIIVLLIVFRQYEKTSLNLFVSIHIKKYILLYRLINIPTYISIMDASNIIPYATLYYIMYLIDRGINILPEGM